MPSFLGPCLGLMASCSDVGASIVPAVRFAVLSHRQKDGRGSASDGYDDARIGASGSMAHNGLTKREATAAFAGPLEPLRIATRREPSRKERSLPSCG